MHSLQKAAILWLPPVAFFMTAVYRVFVLYRQSRLDLAYWKSLEYPAVALWSPIAFLQTYRLLRCGKQLLEIKATTFWSMLLTTVAIRFLTLLSALCCSYHNDLHLYEVYTILPLFYSVLCHMSEWTYLGNYEGYSYDEASRTAIDAHGSVLHQFKPDEDLDYFSWRDLTVRLAYIVLIHNFLHVIWLRFFDDNAPYTVHINNSELFTVLLAIQLCIYSYARVRTRIKVHYDVEAGGAQDEKDEV